MKDQITIDEFTLKEFEDKADENISTLIRRGYLDANLRSQSIKKYITLATQNWPKS